MANVQAAAARGERLRAGSISVRARFGVALAVGTGMLAVIVLTRWGIGTSPDSVAYLGTAENVLAGRGLTVPFGAASDSPLTQFPPLYPLALALAGGTGLGVGLGARLLAALLLAVNLVLAAGLAAQAAPSRRWVPAAAAWALLLSPPTLALHSMAWSEPLWLSLGFGGLLLWVRHLEAGGWRALVGGGLLLALAGLARYAGAAFLLAVMLITLLWRPGRARLWPALAVLAASGLPLAAWLLFNRAVTGTAANRDLAFHPVQAEHARQLLDTLAGWLLVPLGAPAVVKLLAVLAVFGGLPLALWLAGRQAATPGRWQSAGAALLLFCLTYLAFLALSISFVDANTPLDDRILAPVHLAAVAAVTAGVGRLLAAPGLSPRWRALALVVITAAALVSAYRVGAWARPAVAEGLGFNHAAWRASPLLGQVAALPPETVLYSDSPEAIYTHTGRRALRPPRAFNIVEQTPNPAYDEQVAAMAAALRAGGVLVEFSSVRGSAQAELARLIETLELTVLAETADGALYGYAR